MYFNKKLFASQFYTTLKDSVSNIFIEDLTKANEFNAYFASDFQLNTNRGSDRTTNLDDNKPNKKGELSLPVNCRLISQISYSTLL